MNLSFKDVINWLGGDGEYMNSVHCMGHDWLWIWITIFLCAGITLGYFFIAAHWSRNERHLTNSPAKKALNHLKWIFVYCGFCGYGFTIVKMWWPAWRLMDITMMFLFFYTWKYVFLSQDLRVVYEQLKENVNIREALNKTYSENATLKFYSRELQEQNERLHKKVEELEGKST